jgi:carboxyl-terminal processing protease
MSPLLFAIAVSTGCGLDSTDDGAVGLADERAALQAAEAERLRTAARNGLDSTAPADWVAAAETIAVGRFLPGRADAFAALQDRLEARAAEAAPEVQAQIHNALYETETDPAERARHRRITTDARVRARYATDDAASLTRQEQAGVTVEMAHAAIETLLAEYVRPLDPGSLLEGAAHRLSILPGVDGPIAPPPPGTPVVAGFDALLQLSAEHDVPREVAIAELTEAIFEAADSWSGPVWPAQVAAWERHHDGVRAGIVGIQVAQRDGSVIVSALVEDGPAWTAGVHQGDRLLRIRHETGVADLTEPQDDPVRTAVEALRGPDGTAVTLFVERSGEEKAFTLPRATLAERTVFGWQRDGLAWSDPMEGVAFAHIARFRPHTLDELDAVLPPEKADATEAVVLDLRGNGGGDLSIAAAVIDRFVAEGPMLVLEGRTTGDAEVDAALLAQRAEGTIATAGDPWEGKRLVVLVDGESASSAEIVAGSLQQAADAHVIGSRTAGKGVSQVLRVDEEHGFAMQFTNLAWALPDGRWVHRSPGATTWGITPDTEVPLTPTERFVAGVMAARREALAVHADGSPMAYTGPEVDPALPKLSVDPQLDAAFRIATP